MPETTSPPAAPPSSAVLRVVLFGMPDAGKSSLLGALAQAATTQEQVLNGRLVDRSQGLLELQRRLYEDRPRETLEEVVPYPVALEPLATAGGPPNPAPRDVVLVDCDGRVANDLLSRRRTLGPGEPDGALAREVLDADTLVLVVDAASSPQAIEHDFAQFGRFLHLLEQNRGRRSEVGGLPVYLVLTKCDLLAKSSDSNIAWMERIEERKRQVDRKFKEFLAGQAEQAPLPFGKIELHLWATAVKRPALADAPAKPREPYGVAELFRQCLDSAVTFRARRSKATRRLGLTLAGVLALAAGMLLLALFFLATRPGNQATALETEVRNFRSAHDRPGDLLKEPVATRIEQLRKIRNSPDFLGLPDDLREYVDQRLRELDAYQAYVDRLNAAGNSFAVLSSIHSEEELARLRERLEKAAPPPEFAASWAESSSLRRRRDLLKETRSLEAAVRQLKAVYQKLVNDARQVRQALKQGEGNVPTRAQQILDRAKEAPDKVTNRDDFIPGSERVTYATAFAFTGVEALYQEWLGQKKALEDIIRVARMP
jgi:hypothetical protein